MAAPEGNGFPSSDRRACGTPAGRLWTRKREALPKTAVLADDAVTAWWMVGRCNSSCRFGVASSFASKHRACSLFPRTPAWNQTLTDATGPITVAPQTHFLQPFPQIHQPSALIFRTKTSL
jgi:hypothetical protein